MISPALDGEWNAGGAGHATRPAISAKVTGRGGERIAFARLVDAKVRKGRDAPHHHRGGVSTKSSTRGIGLDRQGDSHLRGLYNGVLDIQDRHRDWWSDRFSW